MLNKLRGGLLVASYVEQHLRTGSILLGCAYQFFKNKNKLTKRKTNEKKNLTEIEFRQSNWRNSCQFLSPHFSWISATWIPKYQNYIRFVRFSLFFYLYFGITNTENCISPHLAKKLCTVYINLTNSKFYNIKPKDSHFLPMGRGEIFFKSTCIYLKWPNT